jgi:hypothetical protein
MKKTLLFLSLALFIAAGVVTISKVKQVNAANTNTELSFAGDDQSSIWSAPQDGDKAKKDDKCKTKDGKTDCSKTCGSKSKGGEAKCAAAKCTETSGSKCCSKEKEKSTEKDKK